jgi:MSHA biogenesis protein MshP
MSRSERSQRGIGAIFLIAILVMISAFAGAVGLLSQSQHTGSALDLLGAKAYQSARAGLEWGIHRVLRGSSADCTAIESGGAGTTFLFAGDLAGFQVTVNCAFSTHTEVATTVTMYALNATGCNLTAGSCLGVTPSTPFYVERQLRVTVGTN